MKSRSCPAPYTPLRGLGPKTPMFGSARRDIPKGLRVGDRRVDPVRPLEGLRAREAFVTMERVERRLAAVLAADVAGYNRIDGSLPLTRSGLGV